VDTQPAVGNHAHPCGPPHACEMDSPCHPEMSHGVRCSLTMFTKQVSRPVDGPVPHRGRRGGAGRANSKKDLVTDPIRVAVPYRLVPTLTDSRWFCLGSCSG